MHTRRPTRNCARRRAKAPRPPTVGRQEKVKHTLPSEIAPRDRTTDCRQTALNHPVDQSPPVLPSADENGKRTARRSEFVSPSSNRIMAPVLVENPAADKPPRRSRHNQSVTAFASIVRRFHVRGISATNAASAGRRPRAECPYAITTPTNSASKSASSERTIRR